MRWLIIVLVLLAACTSEDDISLDVPPESVDCPSAPEALIIADGWTFTVEGGEQIEGIVPGEAWENLGLDYDGVGWYRNTFSLPDWDVIYLMASRIDDRAGVWLNDDLLVEWVLGADDVDWLDLSAYRNQTVSLAIRVEDTGGAGGLLDPLRLVQNPIDGMSSTQYVKWLSKENPEWPMPDWTIDNPLAWTMTGGVNQASESLVSMDGAVAPWPDAPIVEAWLYDAETGELMTGHRGIEFSLVRGNLPLPEWRWPGMANTLFFDAEDAAVRWQIHIDEAVTATDLYIVVRPFAVNKAANPIHSIAVKDKTHVWLNGQPFMNTEQTPDAVSAAPVAALMSGLLSGELPDDDGLPCASYGDGAMVMRFEIKAGATFNFAFPAALGGAFPAIDVDADARLQIAMDQWQALTERTRFILPDQLITASVPVSVGYLLLANDPNGPHPGSLAHSSVWVRDAVYTGLALLQTGHADTVKNYIPSIWDDQQENGKVPPIQGDSIPWDDDEWDSQGQAIFLTTAYYRYTDDKAILETWYPNMRLAAEFIIYLLDNSDIEGILPASLSAEDLGPADHHYYWDNLWAVTGLEAAAFAALELGEVDDAEWMQARADKLRAAILASVGDMPYIPAAIEDTESSGMARGTVPALWPYRVFDPQTLQSAFDHYHTLWIEPFDGAYYHRIGQFWPYGGIELAHAYMRLGRGDVVHQILGWTLRNQTLPGTFSWAEQVSPSHGGFTGGDMPHAWAAGSYATLIREMLISEWGDKLYLFTTAPEWWFEEERVIRVENAPTHFGTLDMTVENSLYRVDDRWQGTVTLSLAGATPPDGFYWQLPFTPASMEGIEGTIITDENWLVIPSSGVLTLTFR